MAGVLNLSPHQNVQTLECEQGYHTVKCLGSNSVKQFLFSSSVIFLITAVNHFGSDADYVSLMQSLMMKSIYFQENLF